MPLIANDLLIELKTWAANNLLLSGLFTHEPRAVTMKSWEPIRKCPKAVPRHLQNHVLWSRTLKCSVKSYVTGPSTKCYNFNELLFMRILTHDKNRTKQLLWTFGVPWSPNGFLLSLPPTCGFGKKVQVTMNHHPFDAMLTTRVGFTSILHARTLLVPQA